MYQNNYFIERNKSKNYHLKKYIIGEDAKLSYEDLKFPFEHI